MTQIGILSDTHMSSIDERFIQRVTTAFDGCDIIIHAGDLTDVSILTAFKGKTVYAVCGNMCNWATRQVLPTEQMITIDGYSLAVTHGEGPRHTIEDRVFGIFPTADCIIYGHTHIPSCQKIGKTILVNPGSFQGTGKFGYAGTYAILSILKSGIRPTIHTLAPSL